ncbi:MULTISPECIES: GtrA family protein [unclassified Microbacterium]|uniref:GtrA family protein n=1 Tax=unclassified Microbacterium TaxID=2609290 RepID=UPI00343D8ACC
MSSVPPSDDGSAGTTTRRYSALRYLLAGGLAFLVDLGLLALLREVFGWPTWLAAGTAFVISFAFTYTIQRYFTFGSQVPHGRALLKYALLVAFNTVATAGIVALIDATPLGWAVGKVVATGATTIWNYFAYRYWVFADRSR